MALVGWLVGLKKKGYLRKDFFVNISLLRDDYAIQPSLSRGRIVQDEHFVVLFYLTDGTMCGCWQRIPVSTLRNVRPTVVRNLFAERAKGSEIKCFVSHIINNTHIFTYMPLIIILFKLSRSERE
jgi:hypothetical protein